MGSNPGQLHSETAPAQYTDQEPVSLRSLDPAGWRLRRCHPKRPGVLRRNYARMEGEILRIRSIFLARVTPERGGIPEVALNLYPDANKYHKACPE